MIPKETVDLIIDSSRIDEVVGEFVALKKRGASMIVRFILQNAKLAGYGD